MQNKINYELDTRIAYRNPVRARSYKRHHTQGLTWARFTMWRECRCVEKALRKCNLSNVERILDSPCGTGILGNLFRKFPAAVIASDISKEMMDLAHGEYRGDQFGGFIQNDMTRTPFRDGVFSCVITLGFMHRLPADIRRQVVQEIGRVSKRFVIISYSIDDPSQRLKQWILKQLIPAYRPAPSPIPIRETIEEFNAHGLTVQKVYRVAWFFSAEVVFLLERQG